ncbi:hypothetical protein B0H14DRAFT_2579279 [Mycena olivaceomarginata]|nr:hypothetical protein B0H14DRAFT_2579279 [Mycena olivaceomarginata]
MRLYQDHKLTVLASLFWVLVQNYTVMCARVTPGLTGPATAVFLLCAVQPSRTAVPVSTETTWLLLTIGIETAPNSVLVSQHGWAHGGWISGTFMALDVDWSDKKIEPKSCGEIFEPKKLVKFETKVGEMQLGQ